MPSIYDDPGYLFSGSNTQAAMEGDINAQRARNILAQEKARAIEMQLAEEEAFDPTRRAIEARQGDLAYERLLPMGARSRINASFQSPEFGDVTGGASSSAPGARAIESAGPPMETRAIERDFGPTKDDPMGGTTVGEYLTYGRQRGLIDAKEQAALAQAARIPDLNQQDLAMKAIKAQAANDRESLTTSFGLSRRISSNAIYERDGGV